MLRKLAERCLSKPTVSLVVERPKTQEEPGAFGIFLELMPCRIMPFPAPPTSKHFNHVFGSQSATSQQLFKTSWAIDSWGFRFLMWCLSVWDRESFLVTQDNSTVFSYWKIAGDDDGVVRVPDITSNSHEMSREQLTKRTQNSWSMSKHIFGLHFWSGPAKATCKFAHDSAVQWRCREDHILMVAQMCSCQDRHQHEVHSKMPWWLPLEIANMQEATGLCYVASNIKHFTNLWWLKVLLMLSPPTTSNKNTFFFSSCRLLTCLAKTWYLSRMYSGLGLYSVWTVGYYCAWRYVRVCSDAGATVRSASFGWQAEMVGTLLLSCNAVLFSTCQLHLAWAGLPKNSTDCMSEKSCKIIQYVATMFDLHKSPQE